MLPIIRYEVIEGGEKGQTVALATKLAINKFFSLGVPNIQNECNSVARRHCALWKTRASMIIIILYIKATILLIIGASPAAEIGHYVSYNLFFT
jgi:hypothetical protein